MQLNELKGSAPKERVTYVAFQQELKLLLYFPLHNLLEPSLVWVRRAVLILFSWSIVVDGDHI